VFRGSKPVLICVHPSLKIRAHIRVNPRLLSRFASCLLSFFARLYIKCRRHLRTRRSSFEQARLTKKTSPQNAPSKKPLRSLCLDKLLNLSCISWFKTSAFSAVSAVNKNKTAARCFFGRPQFYYLLFALPIRYFRRFTLHSSLFTPFRLCRL